MDKQYKEIIEMCQQVMTKIKDMVSEAQSETVMDELQSIVENEILDHIPIELIQKDYYTRTTIKSLLEPEYENNTEFVNKLMRQCWEQDIIAITDNCGIVDDIRELADDITMEEEND